MLRKSNIGGRRVHKLSLNIHQPTTAMKRNLSVDILKFIMAFFIVGLHGELFADISDSLYYYFCQGIARIGVPIFLLISGFYFYESKAEFSSWIKRLIYLYIIWMIIYADFWFRLDYRVIKDVIFGFGPLWYIAGTLFAFIFIGIIRNLKLNKQIALVVGCGILGILLQYGKSYDLPDASSLLYKLNLHMYRNGLFFCFPFIMIGYFINKFSLHKKYINWLLLLILGVFLLLIETVINYNYSGNGFDILLSLYLLCPVLFIYTLNKEFYSTNKTLALYSTGIYLIHHLVLFVLRRLELFTPSILVIVTFLISIFLTFFLIKIKKKFKYIM